MASSTLAGTRLRKDLKDVAASVSVITKDFMDDIAVNRLEELLTYTMGTEVAGLSGNFSGSGGDGSNNFTNFDGVNEEPNATIRLRNLSAGGSGGKADITRDYFISDIPSDGYNVERHEIVRGPNGMLFGLGSPGGIINTGLNKAHTTRRSTSVRTQLASFGSSRISIDHNEVLIPGKLALRLDGLYGDARYRQEFAYNLDRRVYGALTYRPFRTTTIRVNAEMANNKNNKPQIHPLQDFYSYWWAIGQPVYNPYTNTARYLGTPPTNTNLQPINPVTGARNSNFFATWGSPGINLVNDDPNVRNVHGELYSQTRVIMNSAGTLAINNNLLSLQGANNYLRVVKALEAGYTTPNQDARYNFWQLPMSLDTNVYNFYTQMLEGPNKYELSRWKTVNVTLEQQLGKHAGVEVSFDSQRLDYSWQTGPRFSDYAIRIDINETLLDGSPNPNFLRPGLNSVGYNASDDRDRKAGRISAYYEYDFKRLFGEESRWAKILGKHTVNASYVDQRAARMLLNGRALYAGLDFWQAESINQTISNNRGSGNMRIPVTPYLGPSIAGLTGPEQVRLQGVKVDVMLPPGRSLLDSAYYAVPPAGSATLGTWSRRTFSVYGPELWDKSTVAMGASKQKQKYTSNTAVLDSTWFDGSLITTIGWRQDSFDTYDAGTSEYGPDGLKILDPNVWYPKLTASGDKNTTNYGVVYHAPKFIKKRLPLGANISLFYNKADNFRAGPPRGDVFGDPIPPESGKTDDYGVLVTVLDGRINMRVNHYHTVGAYQTNTSFGLYNLGNSLLTTVNRIANGEITQFADGTPTTVAAAAYMDFIKNSDAAAGLRKAFDVKFNADNSVTYNLVTQAGQSTSDVDAKGWEYELTANPTKSWRISANYATGQSIRSNTGLQVVEMFNLWKPFLVDGPAGDMIQSEGGTQQIRTVILNQQITINKTRALDGAVSPESRKWRFNLTNTYTFRDGMLKGFRIGGSMRLQDRVAIGYPIIRSEYDNTPQYDVKHPYYGEKLQNYDGWIGYSRKIWKDRIHWSCQLNVRNIGVGDEVIPVSTQPDGTVAAWRVAAPMSWTLSNSFDF